MVKIARFIEKTFKFNAEYVSCLNCGHCYAGTNLYDKTWCQIYSLLIDPEQKQETQVRAHYCNDFLPEGIPSNQILKFGDDVRWYEGDW